MRRRISELTDILALAIEKGGPGVGWGGVDGRSGRWGSVAIWSIKKTKKSKPKFVYTPRHKVKS